MAIPYADPHTAKTMLADLKVIAAKWKKKHLSLLEVLEVAPDAPREDWKSRLAEVSRRFKNQATKPGHAEAVKLCTLLENEFKTEEGWRGLLNQHGRLLIEARVELLAQPGSRPSPDLLRQQFIVLVHDVRSGAGTPDADAVVGDLFQQHGLPLPGLEQKPRPQPDRTPEPDEPKPPPPEPPDQGQDQDGRVGGFWPAVIGLVDKYVRSRINTIQERQASEMELLKETVNVQGTWMTGDGGFLSFLQRGTALQVQGQAMRQHINGQGVVRGRQLELVVVLMPQYVRLLALLDVSPDGRMMRGTARDDYGQTIPVMLRR
jgi:hypothetical protein